MRKSKRTAPPPPAEVPAGRPGPVMIRPRPRRKPKLSVVGGAWRPRRRITEWSGSEKWYIVLEVWTDAEWAQLTEAEMPEYYENSVKRLPGIGWYHWSLVGADDAALIKEETAAILADNPHWF
jgi:hypothetical protein